MTRSEPNLRIPGPTSLPAEVREAGSRQMINHRGPEFAALLGRIERRMQPFFGTKSAGPRSSPCSGIGRPRGGRRQHALAGRPRARRLDRRVRRPVRQDRRRPTAPTSTKLDVEWGEAADPAAVAEALRADPGYKAVLVTHNETSTGVMNPLAGDRRGRPRAGARRADPRRRRLRPRRRAVRDGRLGPRRRRHRLAEDVDGRRRAWR